LIENRRFEPTQPLFGAPLTVTSSEFCRDMLHQKTTVPGLLYSIVCVILV